VARRWYYSHDGRTRFGPVSTAELRELARSGALQPVSLVLPEGGSRWVKAGTVRGLFAGATAEKQGSLSGTLGVCLAVAALVLFGGVVAVLLFPLLRPGASSPRVAVAPTAPAGSGTTEARPEPPDPQLFENPRPDSRSLPKAEQERRRQAAEAVYLDPAQSDNDHLAAANALLGLTDGHTSLLKGLDLYGPLPDHRRRYRWCFQYLVVAQHELDLRHPPSPGEASGIIPAAHVPRMVELLRGLDPKDPAQRARIATTLDYLEQHPEHAGSVVDVLRDLGPRCAGNADLSAQLQKAIAAVEKKR
jgi:hypothetical protein